MAIQHRQQRPLWKSALDNPGLDLDRDLIRAVLGMKVRWRVITVVHPDHNPEESADFGLSVFQQAKRSFTPQRAGLPDIRICLVRPKPQTPVVT